MYLYAFLSRHKSWLAFLIALHFWIHLLIYVDIILILSKCNIRICNVLMIFSWFFHLYVEIWSIKNEFSWLMQNNEKMYKYDIGENNCLMIGRRQLIIFEVWKGAEKKNHSLKLAWFCFMVLCLKYSILIFIQGW